MEERLDKFRVLVESGTFTSAASALRLSQPALSMSIQKLERELGFKLLVRHERGLRLTPAGEQAYRAACAQYVARINLATRLTEIAEERPVLSIGMIDSVAVAVGDTVEALERLEKHADVALVVNNSRVLAQDLMTRVLDGAFIVAGGAGEDLDTLASATEKLVLVCAHASKPAIEAELLRGVLPRFISYDEGSRTRAIVTQAFFERGLHVRDTSFSTSPDVMFRLVRSGRGAAVLPFSLVQESLEQGTLALLTDKKGVVSVDRPIEFVVRSGVGLPNSAKVFVDEVMDLLGQQAKSFKSRQTKRHKP